MIELKQMALSRRDFVAQVLAASACCLLPFPVWAAPPEKRIPGKSDNYYLSHREALLKSFREVAAGAGPWLTARYNSQLARAVCLEAAVRFEALLPHLPDVGGERNPIIQFVPIAAWYLAFYGPMQDRGKTAQEVGRLLYDLNAASLARIPRENALADGVRQFSKDYVDRLAEFCAWSQKRECPGNWVAAFVRGDGREFDYGYDYTECAIVKYLRGHGALEVAPYVCLNDFLQSRTWGTGLHRTKTLAQGDEVCNFRYKQGRLVTQDWSTEVPRFKRARQRPD